MLQALLLLALPLTVQPRSPSPRSCGGEVLLLQRTSKNNFGTWGLPGGNADDTDADLLEVATREAKEEMGEQLPLFQVVESVLTKRGKRWAGGEGETHMGGHWGSSAAAGMLGLGGQHAVLPAVQNGQQATVQVVVPCGPCFDWAPSGCMPDQLPNAGARSSTTCLWRGLAPRTAPPGSPT